MPLDARDRKKVGPDFPRHCAHKTAHILGLRAKMAIPLGRTPAMTAQTD